MFLVAHQSQSFPPLFPAQLLLNTSARPARGRSASTCLEIRHQNHPSNPQLLRWCPCRKGFLPVGDNGGNAVGISKGTRVGLSRLWRFYMRRMLEILIERQRHWRCDFNVACVRIGMAVMSVNESLSPISWSLKMLFNYQGLKNPMWMFCKVRTQVPGVVN